MIRLPRLLATVIAALLLFLATTIQAQTPTPAPVPTDFSITLSNVQLPTTCDSSGWTIWYDRTTSASLDQWTVSRYFLQYVDDDLISARLENRHSNYVQDSWVFAGTKSGERAFGYYAIPLWTNSYHAVTVEYVSQGDDVLWAIRASVTCANGIVTEAAITSEPAHGQWTSLPQFSRDLVVTLEDIPRKSLDGADLGTIKACQSFFVGSPYTPRASISVYVHESITGQDMLLNPVTGWWRMVDVAENYGQPGGQPILKECTCKTGGSDS